ncbi:MAG: cysteine peptidase family C39 domain-containing protein [Limisphaerales bacterium]
MINWIGILAVVLGFGAYLIGIKVSGLRWSRFSEGILGGLGILLAIPALVYVFYYSKLMGEPLWLYTIRAVPGSELLAAPAGFFGGWIQARYVPLLKLSRVGSRCFVPVLLAFGLFIPYLKPILRPLAAHEIAQDWEGEVCLQTTPSTCGPASAATIMHQFGSKISERELAVESFSSTSGTENWYLARAIRKRGFKANFLRADITEAPLPSIAGVRLPTADNAGHFIALLQRDGETIVYSDPLHGKSAATATELQKLYGFTGFFMAISADSAGAR